MLQARAQTAPPATRRRRGGGWRQPTFGVYAFAGGLEEDGPIHSAAPTNGTVMITDGPYVGTKDFPGGSAVLDVPDDEAAKMWAGKIAEPCGWPHEVRRFRPQPGPTDLWWHP